LTRETDLAWKRKEVWSRLTGQGICKKSEMVIVIRIKGDQHGVSIDLRSRPQVGSALVDNSNHSALKNALFTMTLPPLRRDEANQSYLERVRKVSIHVAKRVGRVASVAVPSFASNGARPFASSPGTGPFRESPAAVSLILTLSPFSDTCNNAVSIRHCVCV